MCFALIAISSKVASLHRARISLLLLSLLYCFKSSPVYIFMHLFLIPDYLDTLSACLISTEIFVQILNDHSLDEYDHLLCNLRTVYFSTLISNFPAVYSNISTYKQFRVQPLKLIAQLTSSFARISISIAATSLGNFSVKRDTDMINRNEELRSLLIKSLVVGCLVTIALTNFVSRPSSRMLMNPAPSQTFSVKHLVRQTFEL